MCCCVTGTSFSLEFRIPVYAPACRPGFEALHPGHRALHAWFIVHVVALCRMLNPTFLASDGNLPFSGPVLSPAFVRPAIPSTALSSPHSITAYRTTSSGSFCAHHKPIGTTLSPCKP